MSFVLINLVINIWASAVLAPDSHALKIDFSTYLRTEVIEIGFIYKGDEYKVAQVNNQNNKTVWKDSFVWFSKSKWEGGDLKLSFIDKNDKQEIIIHEQNISIKDFGTRKSKEKYYHTPSQIQSKNYGDQYAWRMFGYDPQQTVYYPFSLNPPLEFKWRSNWPYWGHGFVTAITGCAAYGKLFIGDGGNHLRAVDIETGQTLWSRITTANTMTCALCYGESLLFVGSLVGFTPDIDTTFYVLDPLTGQVKWGKALTSVQDSPIVAETLVYVVSLGLPTRISTFTLRGDFLWSHIAGFNSPVYWQGRVYHQDSLHGRIHRAVNALTGDSLWSFMAPNVVECATIASNKVFFFATDTLFAIDVITGNPILKITGFYDWLGLKASAFDDKIFLSYGEYGTADTILTHVQSFSSITGSRIWEKFVRPKKINGGRSAHPLITEDENIWVMNTDIIYVFDCNSGTVTEVETLPISNTEEPALFSLIGWKDYIIGAHRDFVFAYKGDTISSNNNDSFQFFSYPSQNNILFLLSIPYNTHISLKLFDITGRYRNSIYDGFLSKGRHSISFNPKQLSSGVYFGMLETSDLRKVIKIPFIK